MKPIGDALAVGATFARAAGHPAPVSAEPMEGGRNNRIFRLLLTDGTSAVLKCYYRDARDPRDRLAAEWAFLQFAWGRGVRNIPQPLAKNDSTGAALYSFVPGSKMTHCEIAREHVDAALAFITALNAEPRNPSRLAPASEACFSLSDHLALVERRVARLSGLDKGAPHHTSAARFMGHDLAPAWHSVREKVVKEALALGLVERVLGPSEICISPSDFGFHNALIDDAGRVTFLDFEYAGRDDPAKLVCDFFCQPAIPVPLVHFDRFARGVLGTIGLGPEHNARCRLLLDVFRIKWICIMLNDFLPADSARREFAGRLSREERCARQLERAAAALGVIGQSPSLQQAPDTLANPGTTHALS